MLTGDYLRFSLARTNTSTLFCTRSCTSPQAVRMEPPIFLAGEPT